MYSFAARRSSSPIRRDRDDACCRYRKSGNGENAHIATVFQSGDPSNPRTPSSMPGRIAANAFQNPFTITSTACRNWCGLGWRSVGVYTQGSPPASAVQPASIESWVGG